MLILATLTMQAVILTKYQSGDLYIICRQCRHVTTKC